jgi:hypothetical protein
VTAHYAGEHSARTVTVSPDTPVKDLIAAFWPTDRFAQAFIGTVHSPLPISIEITPDERSIPHVEEPDIFAQSAA